MAAQIKAVVITVSDACAAGEREDASGAALVELLAELGAEIVAREVVNDDLAPLTELLRAYAGRTDVNLIMTTGGTGLAPRDNTPEATRAVIEREAPGFAEAMTKMQDGGHYRFTMPPRLAFGTGPTPQGFPKGSDLTFEVQVRKVVRGGAEMMQGAAPPNPPQ